MKTFFVVLSLIGAMTIANSQLLTAAAIVIGAKILIGKGFIIGAAKGTLARRISSRGGRGGSGSRGGRGSSGSYGSSGRHGREAADFNTVLTEENKRDVDDCAKFMICHLNAKPLNKLDVSLIFLDPMVTNPDRNLKKKSPVQLSCFNINSDYQKTSNFIILKGFHLNCCFVGR